MRPVSIKRLITAATIEERMLHLRKRTKGLLAAVDDADAGTMAISEISTGDGDKATAATESAVERVEDLRYLYGS